MSGSDKLAAVAALSEKIKKLERAGPVIGPVRGSRYTFGIPEIDQALWRADFPSAGLHEVLGQEGPADFAAANAFVAAISARLSGGVLWCVGRSQIYAPAIAAIGLSPKKIVFVNAHSDDDILSSMEEGLRHSALGAVIGEVRHVSLTASRRLILASEKSGVAAFILRPPISRKRTEHVACATRWRVSAMPSTVLPVAGIGRPCWSLELLRCRGGGEGQWVVEAPEATGHFRLFTTVAGGRAVATATPQWHRAVG